MVNLRNLSIRHNGLFTQRKSKFIVYGIILIVLLTLSFMLGRSSVKPSPQSDSKVTISGPKKTQVINKDFEFPLKDDKGQEITKIKFHVEDAELLDEIVIKGQKATAVSGKTFLVINMKITDSFDKSVDINTRDYFRLTMNGSTETIAPDIHNDPVTVQAISSKETRVGFPISETDKQLKLSIGEIKGDKTNIDLNF